MTALPEQGRLPDGGEDAAAARLNVQAGSFSLTQGGDVLSLDLEGRPLTWFRGGVLHKRTLSSGWVARRRSGSGAGEGVRERWTLGPPEAWTLMEESHAAVGQAAAQLEHPLLTRALTWTPERLAAEAERYAAAYAPVSILPPDQYLAVVVQATRGCSWNRCTFCTFYRDRAFAPLALPEFREHLHAVQALLGRGAALRRSVFVADGNALMLSLGRLSPLLTAAREAFPGRPLTGFLDVFTGERRSREHWEALRDLGLRRVYLGLETGHDPLLAWLNKPGNAEAAVRLVGELKAAGLAVGVIFMVGAGGARYAAAHTADTRALLARLPLTPGDLVYLSPFVAHGEYVERAREAGVQPLTPEQERAQEAQLREAALRAHPGVRVARYDIREFVY